MKKPADLRAYLTQWVPDLAANPEKLHVFIEKGHIATTYGATRSFEYHYTLQLLITDFAESPDVLIVPLLGWVETNQPDLLLDPVRREKLTAFEAEIIDADKIDIAITLELSERVIVTANPGGGFVCTHIGEPALPDLCGTTPWVLYVGGEAAT